MRALPKGPRGKVTQSLRWASEPYRYLKRCAKRYGDLFTIPLVTGPVVVTGHPDGVKAVFSAPPECFDIWVKDALLPVFGEQSIFVATGEAHRQQRRAIVPALKCFDQMPAIVRAHVSELTQNAGKIRVDLAAFTTALSLDIIVTTLFGAQNPRLAKSAAHYVKVSGESGVVAALTSPVLQRNLYPPWKRFLRAREQLREDLRPCIGTAVLSDTLEPEALLDNLVTLLIAGHETTAHAIVWGLYDLHHNPSTLTRLLDEIDSLGSNATLKEIDELPYIEAVCQETLRRHPVVVGVTRVLRTPMDVCGHVLPEGVSVSPSASLVHERADLYPEPEVFRPERFLERKYTGFENLPFGGGANRCPGAGFAFAEMKLTLFYLLRECSLELCDKRPVKPVVRGLVMVPARPIEMVVQPRRTPGRSRERGGEERCSKKGTKRVRTGEGEAGACLR